MERKNNKKIKTHYRLNNNHLLINNPNPKKTNKKLLEG